MKSATVSRSPSGKYYVSILMETPEKLPETKRVENSSAVGIDLGIKTFAVLSDGREYGSPEYL